MTGTSATDMRMWSAASAADRLHRPPRGAGRLFDELAANDAPEREMIVEALLLMRLRGGDPHKLVVDAVREFSNRMAWEHDDAASPQDERRKEWAADVLCRCLGVQPLELMAMRARLEMQPARTSGETSA